MNESQRIYLLLKFMNNINLSEKNEFLTNKPKMERKAKRVCVAKKYRSYENMQDWLDDEDNEYVGRKLPPHWVGGAIMETSFFANPFKVIKKSDDPKKFDGEIDELLEDIEESLNIAKKKKFTLKDSLTLYENYLFGLEMMDEDKFNEELEKLKGKNLGCFCIPSNNCHADILAKLVNERFE
jgi:hypothetical protein